MKMELRTYINKHIKDSNKYRFVISTQNYDFINTGNNEISFNELFKIVGLALLEAEVKKVICKDTIYNIEVK